MNESVNSKRPWSAPLRFAAQRKALVAVIVLPVMAYALLALAARHNVAVALFSPGPHTPVGAIILLLSMLLLRLTVYLVLPALLARAATMWLADRCFQIPTDSHQPESNR